MSCSGNCEGCKLKDHCPSSGGAAAQMQEAMEECQAALEDVKHKILILSGKGGVGKSTLTYILSKSFAEDDSRVTVLDLDICGPSIPILFNCENEPLLDTTFGFQPAHAAKNIGVVSIQFFLPNEDDPVIARGPKKNALVLQLIKEIDWGETDIILVDTPPGTSDEHLSVVTFMHSSGIDGAIIVTTPDEVSISDVRREIRFCQKAGVKILGVVENMSAYHCPFCSKDSSIFNPTTGGAKKLCEEEGLPFLGAIPIDPQIVAGNIGEREPLSANIAESAKNIKNTLLQEFSKTD